MNTPTMNSARWQRCILVAASLVAFGNVGARGQEQGFYVSPSPAGGQRFLSGFSLKFGWMTHPYAGQFSYAWVSGLGLDFGLHRNVALGFEVLPYYRNFSEGELQVLSGHAFANLKAGATLAGISPSLGFIGFYAGGGPGVEATVSVIDVEGEKETTQGARFSYHALCGMQVRLAGIRLFAEYQFLQTPDPDIEPAFWTHYLLFGLKF